MKNIPLFKPFIPPREELMPALEETLYSGYIAQGEKVKEFEKKFGEYIGNPNVVAVSSCTAALHLALIMAGVGPGDEVISTPMTAEPTNMAILYTGAKIVWADVNPKNGNIDPLSVRDCITNKTKAIMVVHYGGVPADTESINQCIYWGRKDKKISIIEDCAHSLGATYNGPIPDYACFSFQAIKHMTTVEGGVLFVKDEEQLKEARLKRWFGIDRESNRTDVEIHDIGYKYNYNDVLATMGLVQLKYVDDVVSKHIENGVWFDENLRADVAFYHRYPNTTPSFWFYTILTLQRERVMRHLQQNGIGCGTVHKRNNLHHVFAEARVVPRNEFGGTKLSLFYTQMLHIPCGWWVTPDDREYIAEKIEEALK